MSTAQTHDILSQPLGELPDPLPITPLARAFDLTITPPGSKSLTNRALLMASLASGQSIITGALLDADDAQVMLAALRSLGVGISVDPQGVITVRGVGGRFRGGCSLDLKNAGTATRFLTAAACLADAPVTIDGNARMRQRPIGELVGMLRDLGVRIDELGPTGCVPLRVHPYDSFGSSRTLRVPTTLSSQYVSAVMMAAPAMELDLTIEFTGAVTSPSYIEMTAEQMRRLDHGEVDGSCTQRRLRVHGMPSTGFRSTIEPDASGATYFWGASAIVPGARCIIPGLDDQSLQADAAFQRVLDAVRDVGGEADLTLMPDTAMTLAAVACFARGTTTITGLRTLRVKETDRIAAIMNELAKVGVQSESFSYVDGQGANDEGLRLTPPSAGIDCSPNVPRVEFDTYDDHRMAMSMALIGLRRPNVWIRDPGCVAKTYPTFWRDLARLYV